MLCAVYSMVFALSALTLLVRLQEGHPACKTERWGAGVVICLERDAKLHMAQLMPLPLTVSFFSKIQTGSTFLVPAHPGSPGQRVTKRVCMCLYFVVWPSCNSTVYINKVTKSSLAGTGTGDGSRTRMYRLYSIGM